MRAGRAIALGVVLVLAGCRSVPDPGTLGARPADFALAVTVHGPGGVVERALRPGRYLVEADGLLRAVARDDGGAFPPPARQLPPAEVDRLWTMVRDSGLLERRNRYSVPTLADATGDAAGAAATAALRVEYGGVHTYARVPLDRGSDEAVLVERLIDRLAGFAWE